MKFLMWLTGGRPMNLIDPCVFVDFVTGKSVKRYEDRLGRMWLSDGGRWATYRMEVQ